MRFAVNATRVLVEEPNTTLRIDLKGPLDFDDALPIIQQLIDGIEAAAKREF